MQHLGTRKVAFYAHSSLLSLHALFFSRLTEYEGVCPSGLSLDTGLSLAQPQDVLRTSWRLSPQSSRRRRCRCKSSERWTIDQEMAVCSLPYPLGVGALVRKSCILQYFYGFLLSHRGCLISGICGLSHLNDQDLRTEGH